MPKKITDPETTLADIVPSVETTLVPETPLAEIAPPEETFIFTKTEVQSIYNSAEALMDSVLNHPDQKGRVTSIMSITRSKLGK